MSVELENDDRIFLGHAVEKGYIRFSSVSQISSADEASDGGCLRKWAFGYVFGKKLVKTGALVKGDDFAKKLYHYLTTGEECLPPTLQAAQKLFPAPGPDLECEQRFATGEKGVDVLKAIALRESLVNGTMPGPWSALTLAEIKKFAGLTMRGIPIVGAADFRHRRGEYVDEDWIIKREPAGIVVCETGDLKTMSRIHPDVIKSGPDRGKILPSYVKTSAQVCSDVQMVSYGVYSLDRFPDVTHARLSHVVANKKKREAVKRTGLVSADELRSRFRRIEGVVEEMEGVAQAEKPADVRPSLRACDSFTHVDPTDPAGKRTLKGCGHRYYCPLTTAQVGPSLMGIVEENEVMSLFDQLDLPATPPSPPAPPPPPLNAAEYDAAVAAERAKLEGESWGACPFCGANRSRQNSSRLPDGTVQHIEGCVPKAPSAPPPPPPPYGSIVPPDAPKQDLSDPVAMLDLADPLPSEEIAKITDPVLKAKVEEHARLHAERAAKMAAEKTAQGGSVWCGGSNFRLIVTTEMAMDSKFKYICTSEGCGKSWSLKVLKPAKENGGGHYAIIPRHRPASKDAAPNGTQVASPSSNGAQVAPPPPPPSNGGQVAPPPPPPRPTGPLETMVNQMFGPEGVAEVARASAQVAADFGYAATVAAAIDRLTTAIDRVAVEIAKHK